MRAILAARNTSFVEKRYDQLPQLISGRSLRNEHADDYDDVQRL
ncbi:MAG: hypothetical protein ACR2GT_13185 [Gaiellaceae bacterium]